MIVPGIVIVTELKKYVLRRESPDVDSTSL
jgi:hypothetical protein